MTSRTIFSALLALGVTGGASAVLADPVDFPAPGFRQAAGEPQPMLELTAETLGEYAAPEADQGVAVDGDYFYAVDNHTIAKYARADGSRLAEWNDESGAIQHLNSCYAAEGLLWCANSNYPDAPMGSSVEVFDADTLEHRASHSLGMMEEGSLTWFSPTTTGFIAAFAHYDRNGVDYKDHRYSSLVAFDSEWRRTGGWLFPVSATERMAPYAASGGAIGPDGRLYVTGHDRPEMYVFEAPQRGPHLVLVATIALEIEGQAFPVAPDGNDIFAVDRAAGLVRQIALPQLDPLAD